MLRLLIGFLPWIIFGVLGDRWFLLALFLALAISAVSTARQFFSHSLKILDVVTLTFFVFIGIGLLGFGWMFLAAHMTAIVNVVLMAIAWGSLAVGMPFTIQYAREQVAPEYWHTPIFLRTNQYITAVWGLSFFLAALVSIYSDATGDTGLVSTYASVAFSVIAVVFTIHFPDWYRARALRAANPG